MQKTKIENFDWTWGPTVGCGNKLPCIKYCYARKIAARFHRNFYPSKEAAQAFKPHLREHILKQGATPPGKHDRPQRILVCSMGDLFSDGVPDEWIARILATCAHNARRDQFFFLTKNPVRYLDIPDRLMATVPESWYFGTSVDFLDWNIVENRIAIMRDLARMKRKTWVSFEPLLGRVPEVLVHEQMEGLSWAVIGAQTNPSKQPTLESMRNLMKYLRMARVPIWIKDNMRVGDHVERVKEGPR